MMNIDEVYLSRKILDSSMLILAGSPVNTTNEVSIIELALCHNGMQ